MALRVLSGLLTAAGPHRTNIVVLQWQPVKFNQARRCGSHRRPRPHIEPGSRFSRNHSPTLSHFYSPCRRSGKGFGPHRQVRAWPGVTAGISGSTVRRGSGRHGLAGPGLGLRTVTDVTRPVVTLHWQCGTPAGRPGRGQARLRMVAVTVCAAPRNGPPRLAAWRGGAHWLRDSEPTQT